MNKAYKSHELFFILIVYFFTIGSYANNALYQLEDVSCKISGPNHTEKQINFKNGSLTILLCEKLKNDIFDCTVQGKNKETFNSKSFSKEKYIIVFEHEGIMVLKSPSGNIFGLLDLKNKSYEIASSHLIPEHGILMTKHCIGKIN